MFPATMICKCHLRNLTEYNTCTIVQEIENSKRSCFNDIVAQSEDEDNKTLPSATEADKCCMFYVKHWSKKRGDKKYCDKFYIFSSILMADSLNHNKYLKQL